MPYNSGKTSVISSFQKTRRYFLYNQAYNYPKVSILMQGNEYLEVITHLFPERQLWIRKLKENLKKKIKGTKNS
jgi:hypothetical protein